MLFLSIVKFFRSCHQFAFETNISILLGLVVLIELYFYHFGDGFTEINRGGFAWDTAFILCC